MNDLNLTPDMQRQSDLDTISSSLRELRARVRPRDFISSLSSRRDAPSIAIVRAWTELSHVLDPAHACFSDLLDELALLEYETLAASRSMDRFWDRMKDVC